MKQAKGTLLARSKGPEPGFISVVEVAKWG